MNPRPPVAALMAAAGVPEGDALVLEARLANLGFAIYKKKVQRNGRRPATSQPMTEKLAIAIRSYYDAHPDATQQEIAGVFKVNIGRVNEALDGI